MRTGPGLGAILLVLVVAGGCSTYTSVAVTDWTTRSTSETTVERVDIRQSGPGNLRVEAFLLGAEPTLVLTCACPTEIRARTQTRTTPYRERRRAQATLLVKNALNENLLVYGLGWAALAPVWVPFLHQLDAGGAADEALESSLGARTVEVGSNQCVVEVADEIEVESENAKTEPGEDVRAGPSRPLQGAPVRIEVGSGAFERVTDGRGGVAVPLRALLEHGVEPSFAVTLQPDTPFANRTELSLTDGPFAKVWRAAIAMLLGGEGATPPSPPAAPADPEAALRELAHEAAYGATLKGRWLAAARLPHLARLAGGMPPVTRDERRLLEEIEREVARGSSVQRLVASIEKAVKAAPWCGPLHAGKAEAALLAGKPTEALVALSLAHTMEPQASPRATELRARFTRWAADLRVEIVRGDKRSEVEMVRQALWEKPGSDVKALAARHGLTETHSTYGAEPLSMPPLFAPGRPSEVLAGLDGGAYFWRFSR